MEFTELLASPGFRRWAGQFLVAVFLVGGCAILAMGLALVFRGAASLRFFTGMNRWVSTRRALKPVEVQRDTRQAVQRYRKGLAVLFIAGGAYALYGLTYWYNANAVIWFYGLGYFKPAFALWVVESVRWVLIVGNLAAIVVGILLAFFPQRLAALESGGARWYSERSVVKDRDAMNLTLDRWVAESPRASGWIMTFSGLVLVGIFGSLLPAMI